MRRWAMLVVVLVCGLVEEPGSQSVTLLLTTTRVEVVLPKGGEGALSTRL